MLQHLYVCFVLILNVVSCSGKFLIPDLIFEAHQSGGFTAAIPASPGVELFAFHGRLNKPLSQIEEGDFHDDIRNPTNGRFTYYNPSLKLKIGDVIHYWVYVQFEQLGYRRDDEKWTVSTLLGGDIGGGGKVCQNTVTRSGNKAQVCGGDVLFEDNFNGLTLNTSKWMIEQYIPTEPDYEFTIYKKDKDVIFLENDMLCIKPKVTESETELWNTVDLKDGCTRTQEDQCFYEPSFIPQNPVTSARIVSTTSFSFGNIEIRAKLPKGDWLYPEIYLEMENDPIKKIWIAYSRGNAVLKGAADDIGGTLLFGGPTIISQEPGRSKYLSSYKYNKVLSNDFHTYSLKWTATGMDLYIDGVKFGALNAGKLQETAFTSPQAVRLVLGLGVGGITDFPDDYKSGTYSKPWKNRERQQIKKFFTSKQSWLPTWVDGGQLKIDYVKITAV